MRPTTLKLKSEDRASYLAALEKLEGKRWANVIIGQHRLTLIPPNRWYGERAGKLLIGKKFRKIDAGRRRAVAWVREWVDEQWPPPPKVRRLADLPLMFTGPMMLANLNGTKCCTRRTSGLDDVNFEPDNWTYKGVLMRNKKLVHVFAADEEPCLDKKQDFMGEEVLVPCPYGQPAPGRNLWARETWALCELRRQPTDEYVSVEVGGPIPKALPEGDHIAYRADTGDDAFEGRWTPAIHMPRWATRFIAPILTISPVRLHDMDDHDAWWEGFESKAAFLDYWRKLHGSKTLYGADVNPWVWAIHYANPNKR